MYDESKSTLENQINVIRSEIIDALIVLKYKVDANNITLLDEKKGTEPVSPTLMTENLRIARNNFSKNTIEFVITFDLIFMGFSIEEIGKFEDELIKNNPDACFHYRIINIIADSVYLKTNNKAICLMSITK